MPEAERYARLWKGGKHFGQQNAPYFAILRTGAGLSSRKPLPQEIITFRPSAAVQRRFTELLALNRERDLTAAEEEELDHYIQIDRMMSLLKAKAYRRLDS